MQSPPEPPPAMTAAARRLLAGAPALALAAAVLPGLAGCTDSQVGSIPESSGPDPRTAGAADRPAPRPAPGPTARPVPDPRADGR